MNESIDRLLAIADEISVEGHNGWGNEIRDIVETLAKAQPKVIIACDGGLVQDVCSNVPVEYAVIDYDVEDVDADRLTAIPQEDVIGVPKTDDVWAYTYTGNADVLSDRVQQLFDAVNEEN
jgi:hypothetical protein